MSPSDWRPSPAVVNDVLKRTFTAISEADFQAKVVQWAKLNGWKVVHHLNSRGTEPGWPDLVLMRPPEIIFAELKREAGKVTPAQSAMLATLDGCSLETHVWRPSDWDIIEARLRRHRLFGQ